MIILDTSVWIEFFRGRDPYFAPVATYLEAGLVLGLPWIFGELLQGCRNDTEVALIHRTWQALPKPELVLSEKAWLLAGEQSYRGKRISKGIGLIDAAIIAIAIEYKAKVWSIDKNLTKILKVRRLAHRDSLE